MQVAFGVFRASDGLVKSGRALHSPVHRSAEETVDDEADSRNQASAAAANFERLGTQPDPVPGSEMPA